MSRTASDIYTPHGLLRVYDRNRLYSAAARELHAGCGRWYAEKAHWSCPEPMQRGYRTKREAMRDALALEEVHLAVKRRDFEHCGYPRDEYAESEKPASAESRLQA